MSVNLIERKIQIYMSYPKYLLRLNLLSKLRVSPHSVNLLTAEEALEPVSHTT